MAIYVLTSVNTDRDGELEALAAFSNRQDAIDEMYQWAYETLNEFGIECESDDQTTVSLALEGIDGWIDDDYAHFGESFAIRYDITETDLR